MEERVQIAFALQLTVLGMAHLVRPRPLLSFFQLLAAKGEAGVVFIALLSLATGGLLVGFHSVWSGPAILLTLFGWAQLLKGTAYLLFPSLGVNLFRRVSPERELELRLAGVPMLVVAVAIGITLTSS